MRLLDTILHHSNHQHSRGVIGGNHAMIGSAPLPMGGIIGGNTAQIGAAPGPQMSAAPPLNTGGSPSLMAGDTANLPPSLPPPVPPQGDTADMPPQASSGAPVTGGLPTMNLMASHLGTPPVSPMVSHSTGQTPSVTATPTSFRTFNTPGGELPYQTYERLTGQHWGGGGSANVQDLMSRLGVTGAPGSADANLALQKALLTNALNVHG